jgi:hypothetical protein
MAEERSREGDEQSRQYRDAEREGAAPDMQGLGAGLEAPAPLLLGHAYAGGRGNKAARAAAIQRMQQLGGNRAVQRMVLSTQGDASGDSDEIATRIQRAAGNGSPMDTSVRTRIESSLGADLKNVNVHTGAEADKLAREVDSIAFTSGQDIFFRDGAYKPHTPEGLRLLAHEATHTVQQAQGPVDGTPSEGGVSISNPADQFEQAAEEAADMVMMGMRSPLYDEEEPPPLSSILRKPVQRMMYSSTIADAISPSVGQAASFVGDEFARLGGMAGDAYGDVGGMIGSGISGAAGIADNVLTRGSQFWGGAGAGVGAAAGDLVSGASQIMGRGISRIGGVAGTGISGIEGLLGLGTGVGSAVSGAASTAGGMVSSVGQFADNTITAGSSFVGDLFSGAGAAAGDMMSGVGDIAGGIVTRGTRNIGNFGASIAGGIGGLISNIGDSPRPQRDFDLGDMLLM